MKQSEMINLLAEALAKAQGAFTDIQPDTEGTSGGKKFKYASMAAIVRHVREPLEQNGLSFAQTIDSHTLPAGENVPMVSTRLMHSSGQWLENEGQVLMPDNWSTQGQGSVVSYMCRYQLRSLLGVWTQADDDEDVLVPRKIKDPVRKAPDAA